MLLPSLLRLPRQLLLLLVFNTKWDAFLTIVPGILLLATGLRQAKDSNARHYLYVVTYDDHTWLKFIPSIAVITGITAVFLGVFRFAVIVWENKRSLLLYVIIHSVLIFTYVLVASLSMSAHDKISVTLSESMERQLVLLHRQQSRFSTSLQENWDQLQMKLHCCGVDNYRDYTALSQVQKSGASVPISCCVLKEGELAQPENVAQCQADVRMNVRDSIFIYAKGCHEPLTNWFSHFVYVPQAIYWGATFSQSLAAAQGIWMYRASPQTRKIALL